MRRDAKIVLPRYSQPGIFDEAMETRVLTSSWNTVYPDGRRSRALRIHPKLDHSISEYPLASAGVFPPHVRKSFLDISHVYSTQPILNGKILDIPQGQEDSFKSVFCICASCLGLLDLKNVCLALDQALVAL